MLWYFVHLEYNPGEGGPSGSNEDRVEKVSLNNCVKINIYLRHTEKGTIWPGRNGGTPELTWHLQQRVGG